MFDNPVENAFKVHESDFIINHLQGCVNTLMKKLIHNEIAYTDATIVESGFTRILIHI